MISKEEQEKYLLSRIGRRVNFIYPDGEEKRTGRLADRVVCFSGEASKAVYWNVIDLIKFENENEDWIRMSYYRYRKADGRWIFAGQTSLTDPLSNIAKLFNKGVREKEWIRSLFSKNLLGK